MGTRETFTSESVTSGHPGKMCDIIVDAILDKVLEQDKYARIELEALAATGLVMVAGELTTTIYADITRTVRGVVREIGYTDPSLGFEADSIAVLSVLDEQSAELALAVDRRGATNQGLVVGYATDECMDPSLPYEYMPVPAALAHMLARRLEQVRRDGLVSGLHPDGQTQVTVLYEEGRPVKLLSAVICAHHRGDRALAVVQDELIEAVCRPVCQSCGIDASEAEILVNPAGPFTIGGPLADTGISGSKPLVDFYGSASRYGGSSLSGKDPTKNDRSAAYMARYVAKNVVAAGLAKRCEIRLAYIIGRQEPISVEVETWGTSRLTRERLQQIVQQSFDLSCAGIIETLDLRQVRYRPTAVHGHFGRASEGFPWERLDRVDDLRKFAE